MAIASESIYGALPIASYSSVDMLAMASMIRIWHMTTISLESGWMNDLT
jgi:hypothetical protein